MKNKILITGATGFIGSHLSELCVEKGFQVVAFDRYNPNNHWGWLEDSKYKNDTNPIDIESKSDLSLNYSKGYLHHLFKIEEMLGYTIATLHNLSFYLDLMSKIRSQINNGTFSSWSKEFISNYEGK